MEMISSNTYINTIFWGVYVLAVIIAAEVYGYLWHRFGAHAGYVPGIKETHRIHHIVDISAGHEADEDFVWILLLIMTFEIIVGLGVMIGLIPGILAIVTIITLTVVFVWNWWIHRSYHQEDHWLNGYEWFRREKELHFIHHYKPGQNYGVATHFNDKLFGTWTDLEIKTNNDLIT
jgi:sterol desaturase/sphingolipid hydroxylase (fatty acid hydroxylase superfamily)